MEIYVGIPAFNEEKNIASLILKIQESGYKVLVCDDASTDSTALIAKKLGAVVIQHSRNMGYGAAIQSLFSKAKELDADVLVTIDADGQHDPEQIPKLVEVLKKNNLDIVFGSRPRNKKMPIDKRIGNWGLYIITKILFNSKVKDSQTGSQR